MLFPGAHIIESFLLFLIALALFSWQVFFLSPLNTLLFDSQGYLWISQSIQQAFNAASISELKDYVFSGFQNELARAAFVSHNPGLLDLCKSGPVLPVILSGVYALFSRCLTAANWQTGALIMIIISSLTVVFVQRLARLLGGPACGLIAAVLALTYAGFAANAGRLLSEVPACFASILMLWSTLSFVKALEDQRRSLTAETSRPDFDSEQKREFLKRWNSLPVSLLARAVLPGFFTGLLMLARPTFLPWPLMLLFCLAVYVAVGKNRAALGLPVLLSFALGASCLLAPWALAKQVLTGSPSLTVERYGPYNLSVGLDLRKDGYDVLPSALVNQPHLFEKSAVEVGKDILREFKQRPVSAFHLLLRKPARLIDSAWNDFQNKVFFIPLLLQRFEHQLILLFAALGTVLLLEHGRKKPDYFLLFAGLLFAVFISFHFVSVLFISMNRYFVTATPCAIVAAAYFLTAAMKEKKRFSLSLLAPVPALSFSALIQYLIQPGYGRLTNLISDLGLAQVSIVLSFLLSLLLAAAFLVPAFTTFRGVRSKILLSSIAFVCSFLSFLTASYQISAAEAQIKLGSVDKEKLSCTLTIAPGSDYWHWYLLVDANKQDGAKEQPEARSAENLFGPIELDCNGRPFKADWQPLLSLDTSSRSDFMYMAAFAYSAGKDLREFRQWFATAIPAESVISPGQNTLSLKYKTDEASFGSKPRIFADYSDSMGKRIHSLSLRNFSWTKGFFAENPGEMRCDLWPGSSSNDFDLFTLSAPNSKLKARIFLLGVKNSAAHEFSQEILTLPDQKISSAGKRMAEIVIALCNPISISSASSAPDSTALGSKTTINTNSRGEIWNSDQVLRIRLRGKLRSNKENNRASVALIEEFAKTKSVLRQFAPMCAQNIECGSSWREFSLDEIVAPVLSEPGKQGADSTNEAWVLKNLRLQFFGLPWWEALNYGRFKGKGELEFKDLRLEIKSQVKLDLSKNEWQSFELDSQFEPVH